MYQKFKYSKNPEEKILISHEILKLKNSINKKRTDFTNSAYTKYNHKIEVTPYWLLGFLEGEGSFGVDRFSWGIMFELGLTESQVRVIKAIREYFLVLSTFLNLIPAGRRRV